METKLFIVLDDSTECKIMATKYDSAMTLAEQEILNLAGLGVGTGYKVQVTDLASGETKRDRFKWGQGRTMRLAHQYLEQNFDTMKSGSVIDVRVLTAQQIRFNESAFLLHN